MATKKKPAGKAKSRNATVKTTATGASVAEFLGRVGPERRDDVRALDALHRKVTGERPKMWGTAIVGYGKIHYISKSGREGDWPVAGFSPRKQNLTVYVMDGFQGREKVLARLGKVSTGMGCLYLKSLAGVNLSALEELVRSSVAGMRKRYPG